MHHAPTTHDRHDARLVGRCAALALAAEVARRAERRRAQGRVDDRPLTGYLAEQTAHLAAAPVPDRELTLAALRAEATERMTAEERRADLRRALRRELRRR